MDKQEFTQAMQKQQRTRTLKKARSKITTALSHINACTLLLNEAERNLQSIDRRDVPFTPVHEAINTAIIAVQTCLSRIEP